MEIIKAVISKNERLIAGFAGLVFAVAIVASFTFIIQNCHHECTSEHCSICREIHACENNLNIFTGNVSTNYTAVTFITSETFIIGCVCSIDLSNTLVSLKVKLSD